MYGCRHSEITDKEIIGPSPLERKAAKRCWTQIQISVLRVYQRSNGTRMNADSAD